MPYANREHVCPDCGVTHRRRGPAVPPMRCHPCSIAYAAEVARQIHAQAGPHYERWRWGLAKWAVRLPKPPAEQQARRSA